MVFNYLLETFEIAKFLMVVFLMFYAYFFLRLTKERTEKKPWEFLYIACMVLFLIQLITSLQLFKGGEFTNAFYGDLKNFLEFAFIGFLLLSFIFQHYLFAKEKMIILWKKNDKREINIVEDVEEVLEPIVEKIEEKSFKSKVESEDLELPELPDEFIEVKKDKS